jgi:hypothetical protein
MGRRAKKTKPKADTARFLVVYSGTMTTNEHDEVDGKIRTSLSYQGGKGMQVFVTNDVGLTARWSPANLAWAVFFGENLCGLGESRRILWEMDELKEELSRLKLKLEGGGSVRKILLA